MGILILLPLAALMLVLVRLSLRRRRRVAEGLSVPPAFSDTLAKLRMLLRDKR